LWTRLRPKYVPSTCCNNLIWFFGSAPLLFFGYLCCDSSYCTIIIAFLFVSTIRMAYVNGEGAGGLEGFGQGVFDEAQVVLLRIPLLLLRMPLLHQHQHQAP
jgi:hypothetical protein